MQIFDAHAHADHRTPRDFLDLAKHGYAGMLTCAYFPFRPRGADTLLDHFDVLVKRYCREWGSLRIYAALGIHPRSIPLKGAGEVLEALQEYLQKDGVIALGEVGLETGSPEERIVLEKQLRIAADLKKPVILHTPRENKDAVLETILEVVKGAGIDQRLVCIDHNTPKTVKRLAESDFYLGLTIDQGKLTGHEATALVKSYPDLTDRFILNSDIGFSAANILQLATAVEEMGRVLDAGCVSKVACENARGFLRV